MKNSNGTETEIHRQELVPRKMEEITFMNGKKLQLDLGPSSQLDEDTSSIASTSSSSSSSSDEEEGVIKIPFTVLSYEGSLDGRLMWTACKADSDFRVNIEGEDGFDYIVEYEKTSDEYMVYKKDENSKAFGYLDKKKKKIVVL